MLVRAHCNGANTKRWPQCSRSRSMPCFPKLGSTTSATGLGCATGRLPYCRNREVQTAMVRVLREGLRDNRSWESPPVCQKFFGRSLDEQRCIGLGARDTSSATSVTVMPSFRPLVGGFRFTSCSAGFVQGGRTPSLASTIYFDGLRLHKPLLNDRSRRSYMTTCRELLNTLDPASRKELLERNKDILRHRRTKMCGQRSRRATIVAPDRGVPRAACAVCCRQCTPAASNLLKMLSESMPNQLVFQLTRKTRIRFLVRNSASVR